jgi:glycosyltransferase involved in cell wall biosynthesis
MLKVSVILTTYNAGDFIQRTLDSLFNQEGQGELFELEILAVDDCSSDNTAEILKQNKLSVISTGENSGGPNRGRNIGLKAATGQYICIMDHDDEWFADRIKCQLELAKSSQAKIITCGYVVEDSTNDRLIERKGIRGEDSGLYEKNETFLKLLSKSKEPGQQTYFGGIMIHQSLAQIAFEEQFGMTDFEWLLNVYHKRISAEVNKPLFKRHVFGQNLSLNEKYRSVDFHYGLFVMKQFEQDYPNEVEMGRKRLHGTRARYFYLIGQVAKSRPYFLRSDWNWKTLMFLITSFYGHHYVRRKFSFFG